MMPDVFSRDRRQQDVVDHVYRSGSAPPTVEGSLNSIGGLFNNNNNNNNISEDDLRADPAYVNYYYNNANLNPRLPPPLLSKEDWRFAQRLQGGGGATGGARSGFSGEAGFGGRKEEINGGGGLDWGGDGLIGLQWSGMGSRQKSIAEIVQGDLNVDVAASRQISRPNSRNTFSPNNLGSTSHTYASALGGSLSRNATPDPQLATGPRIPTAGIGKRNVNSLNNESASLGESEELLAALSGLNLSKNSIAGFANNSSRQTKNGGQLQNPNSPFGNYGLTGFGMNPSSPPMMGNQFGFDSGSRGGGLQNLNRHGNQMPLVDPFYLQYIRANEFAASQLGDPSMDSQYANNQYIDFLQKAYLETMLSQPKSQYNAPYLGKSSLGLGMSYPGSHNERRFSSGMRAGGGSLDEGFGSTLLDEFKSNKAISLELLDIAGHVVEFSADQYGSRFIQQKLETASMEEKNMVFHEIMPHGLSLMTDVFGNYVVQKFFEHGTASQIRELADQLTGHVLTLSLQMYGCRVIQKAIEVVQLDQQTRMVKELDGHIMRCVRDQNGNHVIQKCIECVPEDVIHFIISTFYDHILPLSTHPYGCRVIQRVLEHCHDPKTQRIMMDEIFLSVCMLAQDQYGNYVVQHVLEFGKPDERTVIIKKLTGQIVQMSLQKFASNVIEKCLTFGTVQERQTLVNEMLGTTDENEPLQIMMKDQFANYVVQKVLETCDDQQLELILNRIKVHLNTLKKYTYGKHIVARVEKLVAAGERRISILNLNIGAA
ncbi:hypothetical protein ACFE04_030293 [Oxalis oulophora]